MRDFDAIDIQNKIVGAWLGLAVGDAMGLAVKGLKPETVGQYFGAMNGYKDTIPFIGKGIRHYKMPGLYGGVTQRALAVCDCLLTNKGLRRQDLDTFVREMAQGGPEFYLGVFRNTDAAFRAVMESPAEEVEFLSARGAMAWNYNYGAMGVPIALFHREANAAMLRQCVDACSTLSLHPVEAAATAVTGFLVLAFMQMPAAEEGASPPGADLIRATAQFCQRVERDFAERYPQGWGECDTRRAQALSHTLAGLAEQFSATASLPELQAWICRNASGYMEAPVNHAAQGYALTLLPLALCVVLRASADFAAVLTLALNLGREADKLGAAVGAFAGARYGIDRIPKEWISGLVNAKELRLRGDALFARRLPKNAKLLVEMESGLTRKEYELLKKYGVPEPKKRDVKNFRTGDADESDEGESAPDPSTLRKEDPRKWREYQKEKGKTKRDRRRNLL
jgi:ADP-ribosylglycohydrolase